MWTFGQTLLDGADPEIVERDDGFISASMLNYFAPKLGTGIGTGPSAPHRI